MKGDEIRKNVFAWCVYCKEEIYEGEKYVVNEQGDKLHKYCDDLISNDELNFSEDI